MFRTSWRGWGAAALALGLCVLAPAGCGRTEAPREPREVKTTLPGESRSVQDALSAARMMAALGVQVPLPPAPPGPDAPAAPAMEPEPPVVPGPGVEGKGEAGSREAAPAAIERYKVVLAADQALKIPGVPGTLLVWIGDPGYRPALGSGTVSTAGNVPAVGESAKVTPFAPAFEVEPRESVCLRIHPSGSAVRFRLKPLKEGTYDVSADVQLFYSADCGGPPVPQALASLKVQVTVDWTGFAKDRLARLGEIFWQKLVDFWGAAVALLFAAIIYRFRKQLRKWFGYGEKA